MTDFHDTTDRGESGAPDFAVSLDPVLDVIHITVGMTQAGVLARALPHPQWDAVEEAIRECKARQYRLDGLVGEVHQKDLYLLPSEWSAQWELDCDWETVAIVNPPPVRRGLFSRLFRRRAR